MELSQISKYRTELMGIATIGILVCHAGPRGVALGPLLPLFSLAQFANALFFMLSGYGLFFSLNKIQWTTRNLLQWYKKRLLRIFIPYLIWCIPFFVYQIIAFPDTNWFDWLYVFSLLSYWDGSGGVAWFLSVLVAFYIIAPLIYKALLFMNHVIINTLIFTVVTCALYFLKPANVTLGLICSNMPNLLAFTLGMSMAFLSKSNKKVGNWWFIIGGLFAIGLFLISHGESHLLHLGTCLILLPLLLYVLGLFRREMKVLRWLGSISLESYLTNGALPRIVALIPWGGVIWLNTGNYLGYSIVIIAGLFLAWLMHIMSEPIIKRL